MLPPLEDAHFCQQPSARTLLLKTTNLADKPSGKIGISISNENGTLKLTCSMANSVALGMSDTFVLGAKTVWFAGIYSVHLTLLNKIALRSSAHLVFSKALCTNTTFKKMETIDFHTKKCLNQINVLAQQSRAIAQETTATQQESRTFARKSDLVQQRNEIHAKVDTYAAHVSETLANVTSTHNKLTRTTVTGNRLVTQMNEVSVQLRQSYATLSLNAQRMTTLATSVQQTAGTSIESGSVISK